MWRARHVGPVLLASLLFLAACTSQRPSPSPSTSSGNSAARPNIVFVLTDDLATNLVPYMPTVQRLAQQGASFSNYYVVDSQCCPSRAAIFTGEYPHDDGVYTNSGSDGGYPAYNAHGDPQKSFAATLQHAGYRTALMGKYLNGYDPTDPPAPGWNEWDVTGAGYPEFDYTLNENGHQHAFGSAPSDYLTDVLSTKAVKFVDTSAAARQPFFLEVATFAPHKPYTPAPRYLRADLGVQYPRTPAYDAQVSDPPSWLGARAPFTAGHELRMLNQFRERVQADLAVDDLLRAVEAELAAKGLTNDTYVIFSSDNGLHMGEYRLTPGKQTAFDTDIRVPLIVRGPGIPAGTTVSAMAANLDLAPTFERLAHAPVPGTVDGRSLVPLLRENVVVDWPTAVLVEHHGDTAGGDPDVQSSASGRPPDYAAVRTADALYVRYTNGEQEYYNTTADPYELDNLASQGVPNALVDALDALIACHGASECTSAARIAS